MSIEIKRTCPTAHEVRAPLSRSKDWGHSMLLLADLHLDNPHTDVRFVKKTLDQARERGSRIHIYGDTFCAMQGKYDPRSSKADVRPEHQVNNYLDSLVSWMGEQLGPYADLIDIISLGNHETSILRRQESDLVQRLVGVLNDRYGGNVQAGTYAGWVVYRFLDRSTSKTAKVSTFKIHYDHGSGGGGPVTKGVIQTNRRATYLPDADLIATGHIHERWLVEMARERVTRTGKTFIDIQTHVQIGTGKEERLAGQGYHVERGRPPKPLGWWWVEFYWSEEHGKVLPRYVMTDR